MLKVVVWRDRLLHVAAVDQEYDHDAIAARLGIAAADIEEHEIDDADWTTATAGAESRTRRNTRWTGTGIEDGAPAAESARERLARYGPDDPIRIALEAIEALSNSDPLPREFTDLLQAVRDAQAGDGR